MAINAVDLHDHEDLTWVVVLKVNVEQLAETLHSTDGIVTVSNLNRPAILCLGVTAEYRQDGSLTIYRDPDAEDQMPHWFANGIWRYTRRAYGYGDPWLDAKTGEWIFGTPSGLKTTKDLQ